MATEFTSASGYRKWTVLWIRVASEYKKRGQRGDAVYKIHNKIRLTQWRLTMYTRRLTLSDLHTDLPEWHPEYWDFPLGIWAAACIYILRHWRSLLYAAWTHFTDSGLWALVIVDAGQCILGKKAYHSKSWSILLWFNLSSTPIKGLLFLCRGATVERRKFRLVENFRLNSRLFAQTLLSTHRLTVPPIWVKVDGCSGMALNMAPHKHTSANSRKQKPAKA